VAKRELQTLSGGRLECLGWLYELKLDTKTTGSTVI
jgi:hypothetical protein